MSHFGEVAAIVNELALESDLIDGAVDYHVKWHRQVALFTLVMALITAVAALLAGITTPKSCSTEPGKLLIGDQCRAKKLWLVGLVPAMNGSNGVGYGTLILVFKSKYGGNILC